MTRGDAELVIGIGAFALLLWGLHRLGGLAHGVAAGLNPVSQDNYAYTGVNAVGAAVTGDKSFSLGSWFYDLVHPAYDPNPPTLPPLDGVTYTDFTGPAHDVPDRPGPVIDEYNWGITGSGW